MSKISELSDGGALQSTDYLIAVRSGGNVKVRPNGAVSGTTGTFSDDLNVGSGKFFVDVSAGNVGIGTTVARELFHLNRSNSEAAGIKFTNSTTGTGASDGSFVGIGSGEELFVYQYEALPVVFATSNTERMRIDSSGNLLVGTTDDAPGAGNTNAGVAIRGGSDNRSFFSVSSNYVAAFNRNTNDGNIVEFNKDGTTVGSIGTNGNLYIQGPTGTSGAEFANNVVRPWKDGARVDATVDLGISGGRFKDLYLSGVAKLNFINHSETIYPTSDAAVDIGTSSERYRNLYLSGGVYLGGTGAANLLDDYEEGDFTPAFRNVTVTYAAASTSGKYVKIGRMVYFTGVVTTDALDTTDVGQVEITLPFTSTSGQPYFSPVTLFVEEGFNYSGAEGYQAIIAEGQAYFRLYTLETPSTTTNYNFVQYANLTDGTTGTRIRFSGAYLT